MRSLWTLALLLTAGCGAPFDCGAYNHNGEIVDGNMCGSRLAAELTVSPDFTADQQAAIFAAGDAWSAATAGRVRLSWSVGTPADIHPGTGRPAQLGSHNALTGVIWLRADQSPAVVGLAVTHELGHFFGLGHTRPGELMDSNVIDPITPADVRHFDSLWSERQ